MCNSMAMTLIGLLAVAFIHTTTATPVPNDETRDLGDTLVDSFTPQQRNLWTNIRDATVDDDTPDEADTLISKRSIPDDIEKAQTQLISSFSPQQRSWWTDIRDKTKKALIKAALAKGLAALGRK